MPRPRLCRRISYRPPVTFFKPAGIRLTGLEQSVLTFDEIEALRLKDYLGIEQAKAAKKMDISQPTFHRLLVSARKKMVDAFVNGKAIKIEGGAYKMAATPAGPRLGMGSAGRNRGRMGGSGLGPSGQCVCPKCGCRSAHRRGTPCYEMKCPECGAMMTRG